MLIQCPECKQQISDQAASCPKCGRPLTAADRETVRVTARKVAETAQRRSRGWVIVVLVLAAAGILSCLIPHRTSQDARTAGTTAQEQSTGSEQSADTYVAQEAGPAKPAAAGTVRDRQAKLKAWVAFVRTDPGMKQVVQRVEVHPGSARGIGVTIYLRPGPGSAIGKAAAKDPAAEPVELAAKMLSAHLWDYCRDDDLREVNVGICLGKRDIGVAATGYMNGEVTTIYLPTGILDK
jgi:RNA polymerase subunit RPABC4/transcription elongation factor Spt4